MRIANYTAHVTVDDEALEEYHIEFVTPTRATCWIASEAGKTFGIRWSCHARTRTKGNVGWVTVDDIQCGGSVMHPGRLGKGDTRGMDSIDTDTATCDFVFSTLQLSDDDCLLNKEAPQGFGEISLEIEHGKLVKDRRYRNRDIPEHILNVNDDRYHESSAKAAHHRVSFGPEKPAHFCLSYSRLIVTLDDEPSLFFIFKYRPMALLRAHRVVPPLPKSEQNDSDKSPCPKPDPDRSQSCDLERQWVAERIVYLRNELKRLESRLSEGPRRKRVKMERESGLGKPSPNRSSPEVIDLTGD